MILNIIIYALLLIFSLLPAIYFNDQLSITPFMFMTCLTVADIIYMLVIRYKFKVAVLNSNITITRGDSNNYPIKLYNNSRLFIPYINIDLKISGECLTAPVIKSENLSLCAKDKGTLDFNIVPYHVGAYNICFNPVKLRDFLGVFNFYGRKRTYNEVLVIPKITDAAQLYLRQGVDFEDGVPSPVNLQNNQSRENYSGVRKYAPGDSLRSIHWKLTAHIGAENYMTRIYESSCSSGVAVLADLNVAVLDPEIRADMYDCLTEAAVSSAAFGISHGGHADLYFNSKNDITAVHVACNEDLPEACKSIAKAGYGSVDYGCDMNSILTHIKQNGTDGNIIVCTFRPDEALILTLSSLRTAGINPYLIYTVPSSFDKLAHKAFFELLKKHNIEYKVIKSSDEMSEILAQA